LSNNSFYSTGKEMTKKTSDHPKETKGRGTDTSTSVENKAVENSTISKKKTLSQKE
jgi:hypothetical protein